MGTAKLGFASARKSNDSCYHVTNKRDLLRLNKERQRVWNKADFMLKAAKAKKTLSTIEIYENSEIMIWKSFEINANGLDRIISSNLYESIEGFCV